jgi:hypothetical protein
MPPAAYRAGGAMGQGRWAPESFVGGIGVVLGIVLVVALIAGTKGHCLPDNDARLLPDRGCSGSMRRDRAAAVIPQV